MSDVGVVARGIRTPIIRTGDNLSQIVVDSILKASVTDNFKFDDRDIIAVTEAVVSISQGNYATLDQIASDLNNHFETKHIGLVFPILSRNRFANILRAIARSMDKITILLSYPKDEVGNAILYKADLDRLDINPYDTVIDDVTYEKEFSHFKHQFTGVNMVHYYKELIASENCEVEFVFSNHAKDILNYTKEVLVCDIHTRQETKNILNKLDAHNVLGLDDILNRSVLGSGYNPSYGLYGANAAGSERVKLFPHNHDPIV